MKNSKMMTGARRAYDRQNERCAAWVVTLLAIALSTMTVSAHAADPITVCIKADGVMRMLDGKASCPPGEKKKLFAEWEPEKAEPPPDAQGEAAKAAQTKTVQDLANRVAALERPKPDKTEALRVDELSGKVDALGTKVTALEKGKHRVTAPFEVVDSGGNTILAVGLLGGLRGIVVAGPNGSPTAVMGVSADSAGIKLESGDKQTALSNEKLQISEGDKKVVLASEALEINDSNGDAYLTATKFALEDGEEKLVAFANNLELRKRENKFALLNADALGVVDSDGSTTLASSGIRLKAGDDKSAELARDSGKQAALRIFKDGKWMAGVGVNESGEGALKIGDGDKIVAAVQGSDKGGRIDVFGAGGKSIAGLSDDGGRGVVTVWNDGGEVVAAMGLSSDGSGGNITLSKAGFGGVFSAGAASGGGGEACLNRVTGGGKQRNVCLGVELPSMGLGK